MVNSALIDTRMEFVLIWSTTVQHAYNVTTHTRKTRHLKIKKAVVKTFSNPDNKNEPSTVSTVRNKAVHNNALLQKLGPLIISSTTCIPTFQSNTYAQKKRHYSYHPQQQTYGFDSHLSVRYSTTANKSNTCTPFSASCVGLPPLHQTTL